MQWNILRNISLAFCLLAAGCTTAQIEQANNIARQAVSGFCTAYPALDIAFQSYAATGRVSVTNVARERQAVNAAAALCADPPRDSATAMAAASRILGSLVSIKAEAQRQAGA